jgi:colicin import membrane protein
MQNRENVLPFVLAVLLHVVLFGSLVAVFDFGRSPHLAVPLAIKGTLVTENAVVIPPKVEELPPEPDTREQDRLERERLEQERLARLREQEAVDRKRIADDQKRLEQAEAQKERERIEAERQREAAIEAQRLENERLRKEAEDAIRQQELQNETERVAAAGANATAAYMFAIQQAVERNWVRPANAEVGLECVVNVRQLPGGEVVDVSIGRCNGDQTIKQSIRSAVFKASPLPQPRDPSVFDRSLTLIFKPKE